MFDASALRLLVDTLGADHVLLGSDYPYPLGEAEAGALIRTSPLLTEDERAQLLAGNAAAFLAVDAAHAPAAAPRSGALGMTVAVDLSEAGARYLDATDPAPSRRRDFLVPPAPGGRFPEAAYLAGNSLGLQPRTVRAILDEELRAWAELGVEGHVEGERPWKPYHAFLREPLARLVGAHPEETVAMNSLTVNLHLLMVSFYRPTRTRHAIVIEDSAFPSDSYAVRSQVALHGFDPDESGDPAAAPRPARTRCAPRTCSPSSTPRATGSRCSCSAA